MSYINTKVIEEAIKEAREFGKSFLGNQCFDSVKDSKKVQRYLSKNNILDAGLQYKDEDGWFIVEFPNGWQFQ